MNDPTTPKPADLVPSVADANVERLICEAYRPEQPDADFAARLHGRLKAVAAEQADERARAAGARRPVPSWRWVAAAAAVLAAVSVYAWLREARSPLPAPFRRDGAIVWVDGRPYRPADEAVPGTAPAGRQRPPREVTAAPIVPVMLGSTDPANGLTPRPRPQPPTTRPVAAGQSVRTGPGERRRVVLDDGSTLYLNEQSTVQVEAPRRVRVTAGQVFARVSPRRGGAGDAGGWAGNGAFVVATPTREVSGSSTQFAVRVTDAGTGVLVAQGSVNVSGVAEPVAAGQELAPEGKVEAAPRASAAVDWARELVAASETPLVPASKYAGGALVAVDPGGQEAKLELRGYHVDVHVEDGFARTTIDQTYFNHDARRLEGTFYFPLPPDAQLSRLAMYVNGKLMEGGMAERDYARTVYESIVTKMQDPALLEWVDGSTFKMRVFPLEGRQEKRIILSYAQKLPSLYDRTEYRFPAGHCLGMVRDWSFHARLTGGAGLAWDSPTTALTATAEGGDLLLDGKAQFAAVDRDVVVRWHSIVVQAFQPARNETFGASAAVATTPSGPTVQAGKPAPQLSSFTQDGFRYFMLRYRPDLPTAPVRQRRDWVFLFESAANRDPLTARTQIDVVRAVLANAEADDTFAVLTAGTRPDVLTPTPLANSPENAAAAVAALEKTHLIGALDLGKALSAAEPLLKAGKNPHLVHVGTGIAVMGERRENVLLGRLPTGTKYVGVAVGKRWSRPFMKHAAARTGGYYTQINPDEPAAWRGFELVSTLNTPRLLDLRVAESSGKLPFLCHDDAAAQGEELCAVTRMPEGEPLPAALTITGRLDGQTWARTVPVGPPAGGAGYLPRVWAKLEIDRLLAEGAEANRAKVVELSKAMYVMSPFTSLLVLENEQMYEQFKVDRGRKDHWALYPCPPEIAVKTEPLPMIAAPAPATVPVLGPTTLPTTRPRAGDVLRTIARRAAAEPLILVWEQVPSAAEVFADLQRREEARRQAGQPGVAPAPILRNSAASAASVSMMFQLRQNAGLPLAVSVREPLTDPAAVAVFNNFHVEYVFTDYEGDRVGRMRALADQLAASTRSKGAFVGNLNFYPGAGGDPTRPASLAGSGAPSFSFKPTSVDYSSSRGVLVDNLWAFRSEFLSPADYGVPDVRSALFTLPIQRLTLGEFAPNDRWFLPFGAGGTFTAAPETGVPGSIGRAAWPLATGAYIIDRGREYRAITTPGPSTPLEDLERTAQALEIQREERAYQANQLVTDAARGEQAGDLQRARNLYLQAIAMDPENARAFEGRNRVLDRLGVNATAAPALTRTEQQIVVERQEITYYFNTAVEAANAAVGANNFEEAEAQFDRSRMAAATNPGIYAQQDIRQFNSTLADLRLRIDQARKDAADEATQRYQVNIASRLREQDFAERRRRQRTVADLIVTARRLTGDGKYREALGVADQILVLDPRNDYAIGVRPLLEDGGGLAEQPRYRERFDIEVQKQLNRAEEWRTTPTDFLRDPSGWPDYRMRGADSVRLFNESFGSVIGYGPTQGLEYDLPRLRDQRPTGAAGTAPASLRGVIRAKKDIQGVPYATISLGSNDNVQKGMRFRLFDRTTGQFLGYLTVDSLDANEATGHLAGPNVAQAKPGTTLVTSDGPPERLASPPVLAGGPYRRPAVNADPRLFTDLLAYAPGMNTTRADLLAVLESEAAEAADDPATRPGTIDPKARRLIDAARAIGWRRVTVPAAPGRPAFAVTFDGAGRYASERTLGLGLVERVVCDGQTMWHLYPDLGVGAKRPVSRFHRAAFADVVPWLVPPAEDLARGADVVSVDERTVSIVVQAFQPAQNNSLTRPATAPASQTGPAGTTRPVDLVQAGKPAPQPDAQAGKPALQPDMQAGKPALQLRLTFAPDGRLAERALVESPGGRVLSRQTYDADGTVKALAPDGQTLAEVALKSEPASAAPDLAPHADGLVVLPLPYRTADKVRQGQPNPDLPAGYSAWADEPALAALAADLARPNGQASRIVFGKYLAANDRRPGLYTLLLSAGFSWDPNAQQQSQDGKGKTLLANPARDHLTSPLAHYIAQQLDLTRMPKDPAELPRLETLGNGFIPRLAVFRRVVLRWAGGRADAAPDEQRRKEFDEAMRFAETCPDPYAAWATVAVLRTHYTNADADAHRRMGRLIETLQDLPGLGYESQYEYAGLLAAGGEADKARAAFAALYRRTLAAGVLPPIDGEFRKAFTDVGDDKQREAGRRQWADLMHETAGTLIARDDRPAVVALARQCNDAGDATLAGELVGRALIGAGDAVRFRTKLAAVRLFADLNQTERAEAVLRPVLDDERYAGWPELWRIAAALAQRRGGLARTLACRERAMDLEYRQTPEGRTVDLRAIREDYSALLSGYEQLAAAARALEAPPPKDLVAQVVRAADRWRSIDPDPAAACQAAARALRGLGATELAWDYLTTPVADHPTEAAPWQQLGQALRQQGDAALAERAYATAFEVEPTNAQALWDRAEVLQQAGRYDDARAAFRQIAEGTWQPKYAGLKARAEGYSR